MTMLNEADIKAALIDKLIERGMLRDAVLINEMVIANWSRRADIAVVNGKLYAFEIKSDFDSLQRLNGQVSAYLDRFDKVTVVTTRKFSSLVTQQMPPNVEIWEANSEHGEILFRVARRGKTKEITCKRTLCGFLLKSELLSFLRQKKEASGLNDANREDLILKAKEFPLKELRTYVLSCLKTRYEKTFKTFMQDKGARTLPEHLDSLSKSKLMTRDQLLTEDAAPRTQKKYSNTKPLNLRMLRENYGALPDDMPHTVLLRKTRH